jgi:polar amino acid transport system permease protein
VCAIDWLAPKYLSWLWDGFITTLEISAAALVTALALGFALALAYEARAPALRRAVAAYVFLFRNSPLLIQLLFLYFGVPMLLPHAWMDWLHAPHALTLAGVPLLRWPAFEFLAGWAGLTLYSAPYFGEEFRAGLNGVPEGQRTAARALGLRPRAVFHHIVWPQALRIATPALFGQFMYLLKNSSLAMTIGVAELSSMARQVDGETFKTFQAFGVATLLYVATIAALEVALQLVLRYQARRQ